MPRWRLDIEARVGEEEGWVEEETGVVERVMERNRGFGSEKGVEGKELVYVAMLTLLSVYSERHWRRLTLLSSVRASNPDTTEDGVSGHLSPDNPPRFSSNCSEARA